MSEILYPTKFVIEPKKRTINVGKLNDAQIALLGAMIDEMKSNK